MLCHMVQHRVDTLQAADAALQIRIGRLGFGCFLQRGAQQKQIRPDPPFAGSFSAKQPGQLRNGRTQRAVLRRGEKQADILNAVVSFFQQIIAKINGKVGSAADRGLGRMGVMPRSRSTSCTSIRAPAS